MSDKIEEKLVVTNRGALSLNTVERILGFDTDYVSLECVVGKITVEGEGLAIENLSKDSGDLLITGKISAVLFSDEKANKRGLFSKFTK